jgi:hypothetical protein
MGIRCAQCGCLVDGGPGRRALWGPRLLLPGPPRHDIRRAVDQRETAPPYSRRCMNGEAVLRWPMAGADNRGAARPRRPLAKARVAPGRKMEARGAGPASPQPEGHPRGRAGVVCGLSGAPGVPRRCNGRRHAHRMLGRHRRCRATRDAPALGGVMGNMDFVTLAASGVKAS